MGRKGYTNGTGEGKEKGTSRGKGVDWAKSITDNAEGGYVPTVRGVPNY